MKMKTEIPEKIHDYYQEGWNALLDNLNTAKAISVMHKICKEIDKLQKKDPHDPLIILRVKELELLGWRLGLWELKVDSRFEDLINKGETYQKLKNA